MNRNLLIILLIGLTLLSCSEEEEPITNNPPATDPTPPVVEIKDVSESVATDIAREIMQHWRLDEISDETYLQHTEDWDSLWHVYYEYRQPSEGKVVIKPIPHLLIPKQEKKSIRLFVTH